VSRFPVAALFLLLIAWPSFPVQADTGETWESLEASGAVIDGVEIRIRDVFDLSDPRENHLVGRAANVIHIESRRITVRRDILFRAGEKVDARLVRETERSLRSRGYIREARIDPVRGNDGRLVARVMVDDAWSLRAGAKFRYEGGDVEWGLDVEEANLFGRGKTLLLGYEETKERSIATIAYKDPRLFGSWWKFGAGYADLSDGHRKFLTFGLPFFSLESRWAFGLLGFREKSTVRVYDLGEELFRYPAEFDRSSLEAWKRVFRGGRRALRLGLEYRLERAEYGEPLVFPGAPLTPVEADDRDLRGLLVHGHYLEDRHIRARNLSSIGVTEDINLGWDLRIAAGMYARALGGESDAPTGEAAVRKSWRAWSDGTVKLAARASGRYEDDAWQDSGYGAALLGFDQRLPRQTLAARVAYDGAVHPAPESILYIGASDGLRGYVNDFAPGDRRWVASLEDRIVTDWILWGMAQAGFVIFADAGGVRRLETGRWSRTYADVGGGMRVGNLKSAFGRVVVATVSFPLVRGEGVNDFEIFVGNEIPF
jgi:hypothetical protein